MRAYNGKSCASGRDLSSLSYGREENSVVANRVSLRWGTGCGLNLKSMIYQPIPGEPENGITLTGRRLQAFAVDNPDVSPAVIYKSGPLQTSRRKCDGRSASTQHLAQEFMGDIEFIEPESIVNHQEPSGKPLLEIMEPVAGRTLRHLNQCELQILK